MLFIHIVPSSNQLRSCKFMNYLQLFNKEICNVFKTIELGRRKKAIFNFYSNLNMNISCLSYTCKLQNKILKCHQKLKLNMHFLCILHFHRKYCYTSIFLLNGQVNYLQTMFAKLFPKLFTGAFI